MEAACYDARMSTATGGSMDEAGRTFDDIIADRLPALSAAEARVAALFRDCREEVLVSSAAVLAARAGTSDATVIRTARTLGFNGMEGLRRLIMEETRRRLTQADRLAATLAEVGGDLGRALDMTLDVHAEALAALRRDVPRDVYGRAVAFLAEGSRSVWFGIGPTSCIADYAAMQLRRFGLAASAMTRTGLLAADDQNGLKEDDRVVVLAYGHLYAEVAVLLDEAERMRLRLMLVTDTLGPALRRRCEIVLTAARGRADMLSLHTGTLALVEALLVGVAAARPGRTIGSLERLNELRARLAGMPMDLPVAERARRS